VGRLSEGANAEGEGVALTIDDASGIRPTMGLCQTWELLGITLL
jgi:hypothetical protein